MSRNTWRRGTRTGRRIMMILAGLLLAAGAVAVWVLLVNEYGMGISLVIVGGLALLCLGLLLGVSWTNQTLLPELRQLAEERRKLNEEWAAIRTARQQRFHCPRCAGPVPERDWFSAPATPDEHQVLDAMPSGRAS
ncbi:MAG: hypothetical protein JO309_03475 [Pseudonocardiales bacterium]|nr:hypothetical protein [Pseudonocardiales bacterium]